MTETKKQPTKALVLGGGGTTGIAWEMGRFQEIDRG
jgi:hypothetical protein